MSGRVVDVRRGEELSLHLRISEAADPLHFGTLGGALARWLWFFCGAVLSALAISGVYIYGLHLARHDVESFVLRPATVWRIAWRKLGVIFRWPVAALIITALILAAVTFLIDPIVLRLFW